MKLTELDALVNEIIVDAYGEDEQLCAFCQALEDALSQPADGFVIGEPVSVIAFDYDGNERRGLTVRCRREEGSEHLVSAAEVGFPANTNLSRYLAAYRKWMGLDPYPARSELAHPFGASDLIWSDHVNSREPMGLFLSL